jgi:hypothetical protein
MDVEVRTDYHVDGDQALIGYVAEEVAGGLESYARRITSVQVHLGEESGARKGPPELRCALEVRLSGHEPVAVTHRATTKDLAVRGAVSDMRLVLERMLGRLDQRHGGAPTIRRPASPRH